MGSEWERHRYIDLSELAGEPLVYLAWRWEGTLADEWFIDDVSVRPLGPDFSSVVATAPETFAPGDAIQVTARFDNLTAGTYWLVWYPMDTIIESLYSNHM